MIVLLTGENAYRIKQSLDIFVSETQEKLGNDAISRVDGSTLSPDDLPQLLTGTSLFAPEQLVILRDPSKSKAVWDRIGELVESVDDSTTLVIVDAKPDKRTKTYKALQAHGTVRVHGELAESELVDWLLSYARQSGINLEPAVASYLVGYSGAEQWRLQHDIDKLIAYGKPITREVIKDIIEPELRASAFDVLDAALAGNRQAAESQLGVLAASEDPYRFFGLLASQVYAIAVCSAAQGRGSDQVAKDAGIHPFVAKKTMALVRRYETHEVKRLIEQVADCDVRMKTTGTDPWTLMRLTVGAIAARH